MAVLSLNKGTGDADMGEGFDPIIVLVPAGVMILVVVGWIILMHLVSVLTGWRSFSGIYHAMGFPSGQRLKYQSAALRWGMGYNGCLTMGVSPAGIHVSLFFPFNIGHPAFFVPWEEISSKYFKKRWVAGVELRFQRCSDIPFIMRIPLAEKLASASDGLFQVPEPE